MSEDCGVQLTQLKVDGGMTANNLFVQMQSDLLGTTVCKCALVVCCDSVIVNLLYNI